MHQNDQHTSNLLSSAAQEMKERDSFTVEDLISLLNKRVFGLVILLFCIPNCLPIPNIPGMSALTGIPVGIIGAEMIAGLTKLWLPAFINKRALPARKFASMLEHAVPYIRYIEVLLHPRLPFMSSASMQRLLGFAFVALALVMSLPIPFGNFLPGIAMALMAIGLIERDGLIILAGLVLGAGTIFIVFSIADTLTGLIF